LAACSWPEYAKLPCRGDIFLIGLVFKLEFSGVGRRILCNGRKLDFKRDCDVFVFIGIFTVHHSFVRRKLHFDVGGVVRPPSNPKIVVGLDSHWPSHRDGDSA
jgi:hypothetical protein